MEIGGWLTYGGRSTRKAPLFAVRLSKISSPWAFARGKPFRAVASLELLAAPVGVMLLLFNSAWLRWLVPSQGDHYPLHKFTTTKHPLGLMPI